jgi:hypothetical protein
MRLQWSRADVNLVLNGQGMAIPPFFLHVPLPLRAISTARKVIRHQSNLFLRFPALEYLCISAQWSSLDVHFGV